MNKPDVQKRIAAHMKASAEAKRWAQLGLELVEKGRFSEAAKAHRKAEEWFAKMRELEP